MYKKQACGTNVKVNMQMFSARGEISCDIDLKAHLSYYPPPRAPNPMALPAAMNAGTSAAKGRRPPFCLRDVLLLLVPLHLFFLLRTMMSSRKLRVYWYNDDGWCVVFIGEGVIYNLNFLLAAIIFRDNFSMVDFLPGSASMAWTIFRSAFHLSRMFLALE